MKKFKRLLSIDDFAFLTDKFRISGLARDAMWMMAVDGFDVDSAASAVGEKVSVIQSAFDRLERGLCPSCGRRKDHADVRTYPNTRTVYTDREITNAKKAKRAARKLMNMRKARRLLRRKARKLR